MFKLGSLFITRLIIKIQRIATGQYNPLIRHHGNRIPIRIEQWTIINVVGSVDKVAEGIAVGEVASAFVEGGGGDDVAVFDVTVLGHEEVDYFEDGLLLEFHHGIDGACGH
jgi:hypothetical protein